MPGQTILIVEDEDDFRRLIARALEAAGYDVVEATEGRAALEYLKQKGDGIALVITDIRMPGLNGYDLADWMQVWHHRQQLIFITGYPLRGIVLPGPVLQKPFPMEDLISEVERALAKSG